MIINGKIYSKDILVANVINNEVNIVNDNLVPLYFKKYKFIDK